MVPWYLFIAPWKQNYFFITKCQHRQCPTSIFPWLPSPFINMWRCKPKWLAHHPKLAPPPPPYLHLTVSLIHNKFNFLARHLSDRTEQLRLQSQNVTPPHIFLCLAKHYKTSKLMFHHHNRHGVFPVSNKLRFHPNTIMVGCFTSDNESESVNRQKETFNSSRRSLRIFWKPQNRFHL